MTQRLLPSDTSTIPVQPKTERISAVAVALIMAGLLTAIFLTWPIPAAIPPTVAATVAYVAWIKTTYANPVRSRRVIATFLCAVAFQFIHLSEEYLGGFPHQIVVLFHSPRAWSEKSFLLWAVFGAGAVLALAAAGALYQIRIANYALWFYAVGLGLVNAVSHFIFPFIKGGYFPGLYTAAGHLIMSIPLIYFLLQENRRLRSGAAQEHSHRPPR